MQKGLGYWTMSIRIGKFDLKVASISVDITDNGLGVLLTRFDQKKHGGEVMVADRPLGAEKWRGREKAEFLSAIR